jgi:uncharacterized iron-regulated membrane protein
MKGEALFLELFKFIGISFAIIIGVFCIAVVLAVIFRKTAWLRLPEETAEQKARRHTEQRRAELMAKALTVGVSGNSFLGMPLGLLIAALSKRRARSRNDLNEPPDPTGVERKPRETEKES